MGTRWCCFKFTDNLRITRREVIEQLVIILDWIPTFLKYRDLTKVTGMGISVQKSYAVTKDSIEPRRPGKAFLSATLMTQSRLLFQSNECACTNVQTAESFCGILIPWLAELFSLAILDIYTNRISVILPIV